MTRVQLGEQIEPITLQTLAHGELALPTGGFVHLQFRRFAGCPICNLHLRSFARSVERLHAAGVQPVAFFHSSFASMRGYQADLPFAVVPDVEKRWYRRFGVESGWSSVLHPRAFGRALSGLVRGLAHPLRGEGGLVGFPADVLLDGGGSVRGIKYGAHADDQWTVDDVIARVLVTGSP